MLAELQADERSIVVGPMARLQAVERVVKPVCDELADSRTMAAFAVHPMCWAL